MKPIPELPTLCQAHEAALSEVADGAYSSEARSGEFLVRVQRTRRFKSTPKVVIHVWRGMKLLRKDEWIPLAQCS